jgi:ParB family chromosome partitioning protein
MSNLRIFPTPPEAPIGSDPPAVPTPAAPDQDAPVHDFAAPAKISAQPDADLPAPPLVKVPIDHIVRDPDQPRRTFSEDRLHSLAASIRSAGLIQPLIVRPHPNPAAAPGDTAPYMLIVGERRWLAARRAGLATVPIVVRLDEISDSDRLMVQIDENDPDLAERLQLFDLSRAVARAFELSGLSQVQFSHRHRRSQTWVCHLLGFAYSEGTAREALEENLLQGCLAARTFMRLLPFQQRALLAEARSERIPITLRRAEKAAAHLELRRQQRRAIDALRDRANQANDEAIPPDLSPATSFSPSAGPAAGAAAASLSPALAATDPGPEAASPSASPSDSTPTLDPDLGPYQAALDPPHDHLRTLPTRPPAPAVRRPRDQGQPFNVVLTPAQLETLLILLGVEPAATIPEQIDQLVACL